MEKKTEKQRHRRRKNEKDKSEAEVTGAVSGGKASSIETSVQQNRPKGGLLQLHKQAAVPKNERAMTIAESFERLQRPAEPSRGCLAKTTMVKTQSYLIAPQPAFEVSESTRMLRKFKHVEVGCTFPLIQTVLGLSITIFDFYSDFNINGARGAEERKGVGL
jgi:hypothetical protein